MRRFTIIGFTEAELGFVLAALFIAVAITAVHERDAGATNIVEQQSVNDSVAAVAAAARDTVGMLREQSALLTEESTQLREQSALLNDSIAALEAKISTKVPQCWEKGESAAAIAEVDVLSANRFRLNGDIVTIDGVRERLASFIARGDSLGCRYVVRAPPTTGVDGVLQSAGVWALRRHFDVNDRPR